MEERWFFYKMQRSFKTIFFKLLVVGHIVVGEY